MPVVAVEVTRFVDNSFPGWVEFVLLDACGAKWTFVEKLPVIALEELTESSQYPRPAVIECEVVADPSRSQAAGLVTIDTSRPWGIEAKDGTSRFVVLRSQLDRKIRCCLTNRWRGRVTDKVPSSNVGARGAQLTRSGHL